MTKHVVMASCIIQTMMFMRVNGKMIKQMAEVFILMQMEQSTMESGKMINNMALVKKVGQTELFMKGSTLKVKRMEKESLYLQMEVSMKENFK